VDTAELPEIAFDVRVPVDDAGLVANVRHALSLGLPELRDFEYPWREPINVVASGPSSLRAPLEGKTVAVNGALRLFKTPPTYWAGCDPQPEMADFLTDAPAETIYLVASKCHPSVFEALRGRRVVLWHLDDEATYPLIGDRFPVVPWSSVTACMAELFARMGFREFHFWGWDACYLDGLDHALPQRHAGESVTVNVGGKDYQTTTTWAAESQGAVHLFTGFPFPVHIHGPGMLAAIDKAIHTHRIVTDATP
jgi:hypothetical protein